MNSEMSISMHSKKPSLGANQGTPESGEFSVECYQNYSAPEVFIQGLAGLVNQGDIEVMIRAQKQMLQRFEKTNEMLLNCNALSVNRLTTANEDFRKHVKLLNEVKKDLDYIFKKIRSIKAKISQQYPDAYAKAQPKANYFAEEIEDKLIASCSSQDIGESKNQTKKDKEQITVEYVQMEESTENGKTNENEIIKRIFSVENANTGNDSSDYTSEDTG